MRLYNRRKQAGTKSSFTAGLLTATLIASGVGTLLSAPSAARADATGDALAAAVTNVGPSIVSLRVTETVTQTANGQSNNKDATAEFQGVVVSPDGLIMCTNSYISGAAILGTFGAPTDSTSTPITIAPQEIRITVGDEPTEYYGTVAASDTTLGLEFIQIRDLNGRQLPFVNFSAASTAAAPNIGDDAESVTRLDKGLDYAPLAVTARIVAIVSKPRRAYVPDSQVASLGLPVYDAGNLIGVSVYFPSGERTSDDRFTESIANLFDDNLNTRQSQFIVPVANVAPLIDLAKKQAAALPPFIIPKPRPAKTTTAPAATPKPSTVAVPLPAAPTTPTSPAAPASK